MVMSANSLMKLIDETDDNLRADALAADHGDGGNLCTMLRKSRASDPDNLYDDLYGGIIEVVDPPNKVSREEIQRRMREHNDRIGWDTDNGKWLPRKGDPQGGYRTTPAQFQAWLERRHTSIEGEPKFFKRGFNDFVPEQTESTAPNRGITRKAG